MNNKISNQKIEVPTGKGLNEKDYLNLLLLKLKDCEKNMVTALTEASNEKLFKEYKNIFEETCNFQRKVYELMFKNGWYSLEEAGVTKVNTLYKELNKEFSDLNK